MGDGLDERAAAIFDGDYDVEAGADVQTVLEGPDHCCRYCEEELEDDRELQRHYCEGRLDANLEDVSAPPLLKPSVHESEWRFTFGTGSMAAYGAVRHGYDRALNNDVNEIEINGENWVIVTSETVANDDRLDEDDSPAKTRHWTGGIRAENEEYDAFDEYQIALRADDDTFERKVTLQFKPSQPELIHHESGEPIKSVPSGLPEGVRVVVNSSNVDIEEYLDILQGVADALGMHSKYYTEEKMVRGRGSQLALYVRALRDPLKPLIKENGVFEKISRLMKSTGDANGKISWNNNGVTGKRQTVEDIGPTWDRMIPGQTLGKRLKHYHRKHPTVQLTDSPTSSPKVEVQFSPSLNEDYIEWEHRHEAIEDLEEAMLNALHWAGVPIGGDLESLKAVYRDDDPYFDVETSQRDLRIVEDPTPDLVGAEEDMAMGSLAGANLTEARQDILELVVDGGQQHYSDLAEQADASVRTVYRTLESLDNVLRTDDGMIDFIDRAIRRRMEEFFTTVHKISADVVADVNDLVEIREAEQFGDTAMGRWMQAHGIQLLEEIGDELTIDLSSVERGFYRVKQILRAGVVAAHAQKQQSRFMQADVKYVDHLGDEHVEPVGSFIDPTRADVFEWAGTKT